MINRKYKYGYIAVIIISIVFMALGAKYDWSITDKFYNPNSVFGIIFEAYSPLPIYIFIPVWGASLMIKSKNSGVTFTCGISMLIISCCIFMYNGAFVMANRGLIKRVNLYICGIVGGFTAAAIFIAMRGLNRNTIRKIQAVCAFAFAYMTVYLAVFFTMKRIFGRDRYEDIISGGEYAFADWFKPIFFSSGTSFPSGHTGAAMGVLILLILPFIFEFFQNKKVVLFISCYVYAFITAISRLVMGRHFVSDTALSILLMTIIFMCLTPSFEKMYKRYLLKSDVKRGKHST